MLHPMRKLERRQAFSNHLGFTLVEMLVVLAIIALVIGLVGPRVLSSLANAKVKTAQIQIESLSNALEVYYLDNGRYPTSEEGLSALVAKPTDAQNWSGPYLKGATVPLDPWGHSYEYLVPGEKAPYDLKSEGPGGDNRRIVRSGDAAD
jgi:general secretion pathway protein G